MSMVHRLLEQLKQRGLRIEYGGKDDILLLCGPVEEKTPEVINAVKKFKPELLKLYAPPPTPEVSEPEAQTESDDAPASDPEEEGEQCSECRALVFTRDPEVQRLCLMVMCPYWQPGVGPEWIADERRRMEYNREQEAKAA